MFDYIRNKLAARKEKKKFREFDFRVVDFELSKEGKVQYAQWLHPSEFINHPGRSGYVVTQENVDFYRQFVKAGDLVVDIGANEGDTTVPMALAVGKAGITLALEPNPHSFKVLEHNATLNPEKTSIIALNFAATAFDGEFTFGSSDPSFGNGGIVGFTHNKKRNVRYTFKVEGKNFQDFLTKEYAGRLNRLALIKIDAEGYDKEIIKTLPVIISGQRPFLITECFGPSTSKEKFELFDLLAQQKYGLYRLNGFTLQPPVKIERPDMTALKTFDIIAMPEEKLIQSAKQTN